MAVNPATPPANSSPRRRRRQQSDPALTQTQRELRELRRRYADLAASANVGVDPEWRRIANDLATALRPYTMFREQVVHDNRVVVVTRVPGSTLTKANDALDRLARQVSIESYREVRMEPREHGVSPSPE
jgi:hypothetical protein